MYILGEQVGLAYQVGDIVIHPDRTMTVVMMKGYMVGATFSATESMTVMIDSADATTIVEQPPDAALTRYDDLRKAICMFMLSKGRVVGTLQTLA